MSYKKKHSVTGLLTINSDVIKILEEARCKDPDLDQKIQSMSVKYSKEHEKIHTGQLDRAAILKLKEEEDKKEEVKNKKLPPPPIKKREGKWAKLKEKEKSLDLEADLDDWEELDWDDPNLIITMDLGEE